MNRIVYLIVAVDTDDDVTDNEIRAEVQDALTAALIDADVDAPGA